MDFSKIFIKDASPTKMGGQAVMEGIMMKGADRSAVAVRRADGTINIREEPLPPKKNWMKWPIIRGVMAFVDSLVTGTRTLMYSASVVEEDIDEDAEENTEPGRLERWITDRYGEKGVFNFLLYGSVIVALVVSVGVFVLLPTWVVGLCHAFTENAVVLNLIEGVLRIAMFIVYVALIAKMPDIKRVFQYHGAEHQTIHCFENGLELTPKNCAQFETLHPRCGTSFIMFVFIISLLLFSFLGWPNVVIRLVSRILLIPVVAGLSYELLRWAGAAPGRYVVEDDYDSEFRYASRPIPALGELDRTGRVVYVNTFAKSLAPGLRIGYLVLPNALMARYRERFSRYSSTVPSFDQHTLAAFMHTGGFERHISRSRKVYQARRDALMAALDRELADLPHEVSRSEAGLHLLLHMRNGMLEHELIERAKTVGVRVYPLSAYYTPPVKPPRATLVLGYAGLTEQQIDEAAKLLKQAWTK